MNRNITVSGIPERGKSTLGRAVADEFGMEMFDKDAILEELFETHGIGDASWRSRISREADEILRNKTLRSGNAVITSWWRHAASPFESGTPIDWLLTLPGLVFELHCRCSPEIAANRFISHKRHRGHLDGYKTHEEVLAQFKQHAMNGPLGIGRVVEVNTDPAINLEDLLERITV